MVHFSQQSEYSLWWKSKGVTPLFISPLLEPCKVSSGIQHLAPTRRQRCWKVTLNQRACLAQGDNSFQGWPTPNAWSTELCKPSRFAQTRVILKATGALAEPFRNRLRSPMALSNFSRHLLLLPFLLYCRHPSQERSLIDILNANFPPRDGSLGNASWTRAPLGTEACSVVFHQCWCQCILASHSDKEHHFVPQLYF